MRHASRWAQISPADVVVSYARQTQESLGRFFASLSEKTLPLYGNQFVVVVSSAAAVVRSVGRLADSFISLYAHVGLTIGD